MTFNTRTQTFKTSEIPDGMRDLVRLTGRRPRRVVVEFQEGPATVSGAWAVDTHALSDNLQSRNVNHWTGSDGEPNTSVTETYSSPVVRINTSGRFVVAIVTLGNLAELVPTANITPDQLADMWRASNEVKPRPEATVYEVQTASPGPFNDLKEETEVGRRVIKNRVVNTNEQVEMLNALGIM